MNLTDYMESLSEEIGGRFSEYDQSNSVIIVPLGDGRYQTVLGNIYFSDLIHDNVIRFSSKVCSYTEDINAQELMMENNFMSYAKFTLADGFVKIIASIPVVDVDVYDNTILKRMITEVAQRADAWELKLTGLDVY